MQRHKQPSKRVCRQFKEYPDGQRRWDQAYQHLLRWAIATETTETAELQTQRTSPPANCHPQSQQSHQKETSHASSSICASLDASADAKPEH